MTLIQGDLPRSILRTFITQLTVGLLFSNPDFDLAFVDGANVFPYYELSFEVKRRGVDPFIMLDRIQLARAFNYHQITTILSVQLPPLVAKNPRLQIVLIPQISSHYLSPEALQYLEYDKRPMSTSLIEFTQALGALKKLVLKTGIIAIMTAASAPHSKRKPLGGTYLAHTATNIFRITLKAGKTSNDYRLKFSLQKHPTQPVIRSVLKKRTRGTQLIPLTHFC